MKITIDTKGKPFRIKDKDGDDALSDIAVYFWKQIFTMTRDLLANPAGGTIVITVPEHATSAVADLTLNQVPVAEKAPEDVDPAPHANHACDAVLSALCDEVHHEAGKTGNSGLGSLSETTQTYAFGGL